MRGTLMTRKAFATKLAQHDSLGRENIDVINALDTGQFSSTQDGRPILTSRYSNKDPAIHRMKRHHNFNRLEDTAG
ncbi:hypothetical protein PENSUB_5210 [Penicillium subrubescens]|uniref:Uncharacterized protein n=1 Tax=Penicillium subrubescens TaxID=1316194 RepID=A0A1Q5UAE6_9EURO|nr:hypothetical protein PENSUB_5210 [Penicillium subrubescens]